MLRAIYLAAVVLLGVGPALASPYWVRWDDGWPENQGWNHVVSDTPAERWLEDGTLFIDSRADWDIHDSCGQLQIGTMTPGVGESFVMHWRVRVDEVNVLIDPGVYVSSDDRYALGFLLGVDSIQSVYEPGIGAQFDAGLFHDFLIESTDMRGYRLYIDGTMVIEGQFSESLFYGPGVGWGDLTSHRSLAAWDVVEYGIVPEPATWICLLAACLCGLLRP